MSELMDYQEATASFDPVLGIEVHVELGTATKMGPEHLRDACVLGTARLLARG